MRFELIDAAKREFPVQLLCKVLDVRIPTKTAMHTDLAASVA